MRAISIWGKVWARPLRMVKPLHSAIEAAMIQGLENRSASLAMGMPRVV